jgi:hypothetical protein
MVQIESYTKLRRAKGRITKGLYNNLKKLEEAVNNIEVPDTIGNIEIETVEISVNMNNLNGSSTANDELIGATIIGVIPNGNQDQFISGIVVGEDGKVTITLVANATSQNKFIVSLLKSTE